MAGPTDYAGDVSPAEALETLKREVGAVLVDVRTTGEWATVGTPDLDGIGKTPVFLEWLQSPAMTANPEFADQLEAELAARGREATAPILFLCRSGARSAAAARAMTARGYSQCFNVAGGFEGSPGLGLPGWRQSGLPSSSV